VIEENETAKIYTTMPMGVIFVRDDIIITVSIKENNIIKNLIKERRKIVTYKKSRILLQILYNNAEAFLNSLKKVNKESEIAEHTLQQSMKNEEVLHMLNLEKSLVYLTTSLKANELVMEKTMRGKTIKLYEEDEDILEDAIIENKQAIEMSQIYSNILATTMEASASIISNNLNTVMKILTSITIVIAIPTLIASFWGMNVPVPFQNNPFGFFITIIISVLLGVSASLLLKKSNMLS
jgi:magnesium transporter